MKQKQQLLIIGLVWPEPQSSAAGWRMQQLVDFFLRENYQITFASAAAQSLYSLDLAKMGVQTEAILLNDESFDDFVRQLNPEVVLFDRFMIEEQFGWRVAEHCPNALRILDTEDLHFLRLARQKAAEQNRAFEVDDLYSDTAKRELASVLRCDLSLVISEFEYDLLIDQFNISADLLCYVPFLTDEISEAEMHIWPSFEARKNFVFIGNLMHPPNWDAVGQLKKNIWPQLSKQLPEASLLIYGAYTPPKAEQLHKPSERFYIMGRADSALEVIAQARIMLAPIQFGAGVKGKLLEAMQAGTPSVTTAIGAEAMHINNEWNGFIADEADAFISAAVRLYTDESLWQQAQKTGLEMLHERYNKKKFEAILKDRIEALFLNLKAHRQKHFLGQILQHHTLGSTRYMAKWIEAKNKNT